MECDNEKTAPEEDSEESEAPESRVSPFIV